MMDNPQDPDTAKAEFHKGVIIAVAVVLVIIPLALGAMRMMGWF